MPSLSNHLQWSSKTSIRICNLNQECLWFWEKLSGVYPSSGFLGLFWYKLLAYRVISSLKALKITVGSEAPRKRIVASRVMKKNHLKSLFRSWRSKIEGLQKKWRYIRSIEDFAKFFELEFEFINFSLNILCILYRDLNLHLKIGGRRTHKARTEVGSLNKFLCFSSLFYTLIVC